MLEYLLNVVAQYLKHNLLRLPFPFVVLGAFFDGQLTEDKSLYLGCLVYSFMFVFNGTFQFFVYYKIVL